MRIFDFIVQTILIAVALLSLCTGHDILIWVAIVQFLIGSWQLLSAIITSIKYRSDSGFRKNTIKLYWLLVVIYFAGLGILYVMEEKEIIYVWFYAAWLIALYYYAATIKMLSDNNKDKKTFLDVVN